jgi:hypothetical protein
MKAMPNADGSKNSTDYEPNKTSTNMHTEQE